MPQRVANSAADADNRVVELRSKAAGHAEAAAGAHGPFSAGAMVLLSLGEPREKFWGVLLAVDQAGISVRGIDLESFDDSAAMIKTGEPFSPATVFFPMHRTERMDLDVKSGAFPSLRERFRVQAGCDAAEIFGQAGEAAGGQE